jgi:uncharacterized protein YejL (UPF0352 family)
MPEILERVLDAIHDEDTVADELTALGMVVTAIICTVDHGKRSELVETFCGLLQKSVNSTLN